MVGNNILTVNENMENKREVRKRSSKKHKHAWSDLLNLKGIELYHIFMGLQFIVCLLALTFPLMGEGINGEPGSDLIVYGFNLVEFSGYGIGVLLAPLIILVVYTSRSTGMNLILKIMTVLTGYCICYGVSFLKAREWYGQVNGGAAVFNLQYYPAVWFIPISFGLLVLSVILFRSGR